MPTLQCVHLAAHPMLLLLQIASQAQAATKGRVGNGEMMLLWWFSWSGECGEKCIHENGYSSRNSLGITTLWKLHAINMYSELTLQRKGRGKQCSNKTWWPVAPHVSQHYAAHAEPYCMAACRHNTQLVPKSSLSLLALALVAMYFWFPGIYTTSFHSPWWSSFIFLSW